MFTALEVYTQVPQLVNPGLAYNIFKINAIHLIHNEKLSMISHLKIFANSSIHCLKDIKSYILVVAYEPEFLTRSDAGSWLALCSQFSCRMH